ncbi:hypothetical protein CI109_101241 [Kwoniella shandongensis]|uniref:Uncharacterized protein n=1 Tax=Kwoniella shandongensis TaxID=1734106 RepID=A0A5M6BW05_9TREE|nr:uncharacterized protein CI109_005440 [Kwoniella shandongensis]KAA5526162.1 hypothetical protein CI109_005440 [Kwoniella shandongensis]
MFSASSSLPTSTPTATFNMTSSLHRSGSISRVNRNSATSSSIAAKRGSAYIVSTPIGTDSGRLTELGEQSENCSELRNIIRELKHYNEALIKKNESLEKTSHSLRARNVELDTYINNNTGPEVQRLTKELTTVEELLVQTQRDNENKQTENERQRLYIKAMESFMNTNHGSSWREDHQLYPPQATTTLVTPATPLPKPRVQPSSTLRHSVSFSSKRPTSSRPNRRASSIMDLGTMSLQAVREMGDDAADDTPTGALRRLNGVTNGGLRSKVEVRSHSPMVPEPPVASEAKETSVSSVQPMDLIDALLPQPKTSESQLIDPAQINQILQALSAANSGLLPVADNLRTPLLQTAQSTNLQQAPIEVIKGLLEAQEKRLTEREHRLNELISMARKKEAKYATTTIA